VKELLYKHKLTMKVNNKGFHPIHYSAANKLGAFCLELLVSLDIDVNQTSYDGSTAMHMAAFHGRTSCAQILYSNGALVNLKNNNNNTP
jgi:ankyrin repeat protein